jgi:hypothetical protein
MMILKNNILIWTLLKPYCSKDVRKYYDLTIMYWSSVNKNGVIPVTLDAKYLQAWATSQ